MNFFISTAILCTLMVYCSSKSLPDFVEKCKEDDIKVNECMTDKANVMISKINKGLKKYNIPSLTPLHFDQLFADIGTMHLELVNGDLKGLDQFKVESISLNKKDETINIEGRISEMNIKSQYKTSGKLLFLPIEGEGPFEGTYYDPKFNISIKMTNMEKDTKEPMKYEKCHLGFAYRDGKFLFENLFNGKKELADPVNEMIAKEQHIITDTFKEDFSNVFCSFVDAIVKPVLDNMVYSNMFQ